MRATVFPSPVEGTVQAPPSKSLAHRAIVCASLARGRSVVRNLAYSQDVLATIQGMRDLGAKIEIHDTWAEIEGVSDLARFPGGTVDCNESGSTLRFLIPLFAQCGSPVTFTGRNRLLQRPQKVYEELFHQRGLPYCHREEGITIQGPLQAGEFVLEGNISSQFISGLLFLLPLLKGDSVIRIRPPYESRSYVDLTLQALEAFGVQAWYEDAYALKVPGNQQYQGCEYTVEGDYSQAAFFAVAGALFGDVTCLGLTKGTRQGDGAILPILKRFGAAVEPVQGGYRVRRSPLIGGEIDLADCPDLGPILTVLGAFAQGETHIGHAGRLRFKESDRAQAMEQELGSLGVCIRGTQEDLFLRGQPVYEGGVTLDGHRDHRIVMSLAVAALGCQRPVTILGAQAIEKSYPAFFTDFARIGGKVVLADD